jgi:hypothetical protein
MRDQSPITGGLPDVKFADYYNHQFRDDIQQFMLSIPRESRCHDTDTHEFTIQYATLTKDTEHLDVIAAQYRAIFVVALFFTVLVDEVAYTHYRAHYPQFRTLTMYPKFIGNCPGSCHYHFHPRDVFAAVNFSRDSQNTGRRPDIQPRDAFLEAVEPMKLEVIDFFSKHMPQIDGCEFWSKCASEFPFHTNHQGDQNA